MRSHGVNWTDRLLGDAFTIEHAVEPRSDPPPITRTSPMSSCAPGVAEARPGLVFAHSDVRLNGLLHYGFCASACRRAPRVGGLRRPHAAPEPICAVGRLPVLLPRLRSNGDSARLRSVGR